MCGLSRKMAIQMSLLTTENNTLRGQLQEIEDEEAVGTIPAHTVS